MIATVSSMAEKRLYRFDEFVADPVRRVLLRGGEAVPITPKALSILLVLLESCGEVVSKEELIRTVWASSYVSEANLTQSVSSLRKALGDRAGDRRYIVTVPGRGYSFAARVERIGDEALPFQERSVSCSVPEPLAEPSPEEPAPAPEIRQRLRIGLWLLVLVLALALSFSLSRLARGPLAAEEPVHAAPVRPSVAVLGFGDLSPSEQTRWLGSALAEMLTTELAAGDRLRVVSQDNVARARSLVDVRAADTLADDSLPRIGAIVGAERIVIGNYLALPEGPDRRIRLDVRVLRVSDGDILASLAEVGRESELFTLVARTGARLRQALGYVEPSPEQVQAARALQPAEPEAVRLYAEALQRLRAHDAPRGLVLLQQAVEADPRSPVIRSALSQALEMLGYDARARAEAKKAVELSSSLPRQERLGLQGRLHAVSQEWERAGAIYRSLWTFYPDDLEYGLQLANALMRGGYGGDAMETIQVLRRLPAPQGEDARIDVLETRIARRQSDRTAQLRAAGAALAKGRRLGETLIVAQARVYQGDALLALGQIDRAVAAFEEARQLAQREGQPFLLGMCLSNLGFALQARGDLERAEEVHREAMAIAERLGSSIGIAAQLQALGQLHQERGKLSESLELLERSLSLQVQIGDRLNEARTLDAIGLALAARGNLAAAQERIETALEISRELGNRGDEAAALTHLGQVLERQGDLAEALRRHEKAFAMFRQLGDMDRAAEALIESASALSRLGNLAGARRRLEHALHHYRRLGDKLGMAEVLDRLAGLEYRMGDLAASRRLGERELQIARETGSRFLLTEALRRIGRADWAADRLPQARRSFEEALGLALDRGEDSSAMGIRIDLVRLALSERRYDEAVRLARAAVNWYRSREMAGNEAQGMSLLAEALLRQGRLEEARKAADRARIQAEKSEDREQRLLVSSRLARVEAAGGGAVNAVRELRQRLQEVEGEGYVNAVLQARLALGEVLLASGNAADAAGGRDLLLDVRKEAAALGFALLARRADQTLQTEGGVPEWARWRGRPAAS